MKTFTTKELTKQDNIPFFTPSSKTKGEDRENKLCQSIEEAIAYVGAIRTQRRRTSVQLVGRNSYSVSV